VAKQIQDTLDLLLGHPPTPLQKYFLLGLGLLVVYLVFERMNRTFDPRRSDPAKALAMVALGGAVMVFSVAAARLYLLPHVGDNLRVAVLLLSPVVGSLAITVPVMCLVQKASFVSASISWFVSVIVTVMFLVIARVGLEAATTGKGSLKSTKERTQEVQRFLDEQ
jgi:hypothetical protein